MKPSDALAVHRCALRQLVASHGLLNPRIFGSTLTGTDTDGSDLDLLVDSPPGTTLFTLTEMEEKATELMGVRVSIVTAGFLSRKFRDDVLQRAEPL